MTKHLVIFQIGPVQDFINCARKTQDYLAGSLIVSYLTGIAMAKVKTATPKGEIIYPFHVDDRICEEAEKVVQGGSKPNLKGAPLYGTVPNRFVATFTSEMDAIEKVLRAAEEKVRGEYSNILKRKSMKLVAIYEHPLKGKERFFPRDIRNYIASIMKDDKEIHSAIMGHERKQPTFIFSMPNRKSFGIFSFLKGKKIKEMMNLIKDNDT